MIWMLIIASIMPGPSLAQEQDDKAFDQRTVPEFVPRKALIRDWAPPPDLDTFYLKREFNYKLGRFEHL